MNEKDQPEKFTVNRGDWTTVKPGRGPTLAERAGLTPEQAEALVNGTGAEDDGVVLEGT